jgi:hypothetical protein
MRKKGEKPEPVFPKLIRFSFYVVSRMKERKYAAQTNIFFV